MIEDKKIEIAARRYSKVTDCDKQEALLIEEGFKEGANLAINEFLKDLWHPVSEEPEENKKLLVQYTNYDLETDYEVDMNTHFTEWKQHAVSYKFMKWCYIEDILHKGGEK